MPGGMPGGSLSWGASPSVALLQGPSLKKLSQSKRRRSIPQKDTKDPNLSSSVAVLKLELVRFWVSSILYHGTQGEEITLQVISTVP